MITFGRLTGNVVDDMIEVELLHKVVRLCTPVFAFPLIAQPYSDWVTAYKDKFMAIIAYEDDNMERPLFLGLKPLVDNNTPSEGLDNNIFLMGKNFRVWINDDQNELVLDVLNNGKIKLGDKNVTEHALLGDTTKQFLSDLIDAINTITVPTAVGPSGTPINSAVFTALKAQLNTLLSNNTVYLK